MYCKKKTKKKIRNKTIHLLLKNIKIMFEDFDLVFCVCLFLFLFWREVFGNLTSYHYFVCFWFLFLCLFCNIILIFLYCPFENFSYLANNVEKASFYMARYELNSNVCKIVLKNVVVILIMK